MSDPFEKLRRVSRARQELTFEWVQEMKALRAAGYSVRTIAEVANVSHDTVWRQAR
jgi:IS30 family transposase